MQAVRYLPKHQATLEESDWQTGFHLRELCVASKMRRSFRGHLLRQLGTASVRRPGGAAGCPGLAAPPRVPGRAAQGEDDRCHAARHYACADARGAGLQRRPGHVGQLGEAADCVGLWWTLSTRPTRI